MDEVLGHYRRYSEASLASRLEEAGFTVSRIVPFNCVSRPGWYLNGKVLKRNTVSRAQLRIFDATVWFWRRVDHLLPWKPTSIIGVAYKPGAPRDRSIADSSSVSRAITSPR